MCLLFQRAVEYERERGGSPTQQQDEQQDELRHTVDYVGDDAHTHPPRQQQYADPEYATPDELVLPQERDYASAATGEPRHAKCVLASKHVTDDGAPTFTASVNALGRQSSTYDGFQGHSEA